MAARVVNPEIKSALNLNEQWRRQARTYPTLNELLANTPSQRRGSRVIKWCERIKAHTPFLGRNYR